MAVAPQEATECIIPPSTEERPVESHKIKEQPLSSKNQRPVTPKSSQDAAVGHSRGIAGQSGSFGAGGDCTVYPPNVYAPQAHGIYFKGYENTPGEWDEYPLYANTEGLDIGSPGIYNDNPSLVYHTGYGYSPQMPYGPYSPATTPLPSVGGDAQLYSPQQYPFSGPPFYQQVVSPSMPYITSPTPVSQPELSSLVSVDQQVDGMLYGPGSAYPLPPGSFVRGNMSRNHRSLGFQDSQQGSDSFGSGSLWSDWQKPSDGQRSLTSLSPSASPHTIGTLRSFGQNVGMTSQQPRSLYGFESGSNSYNRGYWSSGFNQGSSVGSASISSVGSNVRGWPALDNGRPNVRGNSSLCSCRGTLDILSEQNRGPRASKPKSQIGNESNPVDGSKHSFSTAKNPNESYNRPDFVTEYRDAKFFVIKSYSEDNVHKSIKYGVWASTPNGNRKLEAAYQEAKEKQSACHVFLLFSVNASAQFCGVAEMLGPVDFDKNVDYWQQDKWSGQFPVKWHIIKDVPNSHFRHIVLENNDNKPVTNSRDTQEVKLEQGIEMLNIFKNYETDMSILDDFDFYEDRQKAMQERKVRQQAKLVSIGALGGGSENRNVVTLSNDFIKQMSKSFAQVACLEERVKDGSVTDTAGSALDGSMGTRVQLEDAITAMSNGQTG